LINKITLNYTLTVHKKGLHSSFHLDYLLLRLDHTLNMLVFSKLDIDCSIYNAYETIKIVPSPGGSAKTKQSVNIERNKIH